MIFPYVGGRSLPVATTDAGGRFEARCVPGICTVGARARGYAPSMMRLVTGSDNGSVDVHIVMSTIGGSIRGRVVDAAGGPVNDALVRIGRTGHRHVLVQPGSTKGTTPGATYLRTAADGSFEAHGLAPGKQAVAVRGRNFALWRGDCTVLASTAASLHVQLIKGAMCRGFIRHASGLPAGDVLVLLSSGKADPMAELGTMTAKDGSYQLLGLPSGEIELRAETKELGTASTKLLTPPAGKLEWNVLKALGIQLGIVIVIFNLSLTYREMGEEENEIEIFTKVVRFPKMNFRDTFTNRKAK